jgi:ADP-heptose:LPS heptosyltransferase
LFKFVGLLGKISKSKSIPLPEKPDRILVLAPVLRGDYIVLSPLVAGIRKARPQSEIGVVVTKPSLELARVDPMVDRVLFYRKLPAWPLSIYEIIRFKADIVVLPKGHPAFTESMLLLLSGARFRVGLSHPNHNALLTHEVEHGNEREHRSEAYARLLEPFGLDPAEVGRRLHMGTSNIAQEKSKEVFNKLGTATPWFSINVSAGSAARFWPTYKWQKLIKAILKQKPSSRFIVIGSPADRHVGKSLEDIFGQVYSVPTGNFIEAAELVAKTDILISPDTGTIHAAAAHRIPVVVLYNSDKINYVRFAPQSVPHRAVFSIRGQAVNAIPVNEVLDAVIQLMSEIQI